MIRVKQKGNFEKLTRYFNEVKSGINPRDLDRFGDMGVDALSAATPVDSGATSKSWYYEITQRRGRIKISFKNSNVVNGVPIAIILQYGHGTRGGGYVEGRDYINPAIQPIFDKIADFAWKEVTNP